MRRIPVILLLLILCLSCRMDVLAQDRPEKPNFVIIYADDLGWQDVKVYDNMETNVVGGFGGTSVFDTPYMDALATEGVLFRQAYSPACVCAPSRAAILSGLHPARLNFTTVSGGAICPQPVSQNSRMIDAYFNRRLEVEETTLPELLADHGYLNGHIGKWHLDGPGPLDHNFHSSESHRGVTSGMGNRLTGFATTAESDPYQLQDINRNPDPDGFAYDQTTENALDFLARASTTNSPFFCYIATYLVHAPWHQRTERLLQKYSERMGYGYPLTGNEVFAPGQNNPFYAAMVETFDYNLHRVVTYLKDTDDPRWPGHKLIENTYLFLTSDNGGMENGDSNGKVTDNYPLDQGKIYQEEGGTRVPFIAVGPGIPTNVVSEVMINGLDFMPTLLTLAGVPVPGGLDGLDLTYLLHSGPQNPSLVTNAAGEVRDTMYWHFPHSGQNNATIRKGGWKLFKNFDHVNNSSKNPYRLYRLYDESGKAVDVEEAVDLWNVETGVTASLSAELESWLEEAGANMPFYNPKYGPGNLPGQGQVPAALTHGVTGTVAWVEYQTDRAAVVRVDLLYTRNGNSVNQTWFRTPAVLTGAGRAEVAVPEGTTHYVFNLVDENNFLVSYPDVGTTQDGIPDSAWAIAYADARYVNRGPQDRVYREEFSDGVLGINLTRDSIGFRKGSSGAWEITNGVLRNASTADSTVGEGAVGCIIDLSALETPDVDEFTLSFDYTMAESTEALFVHVWGYVDHSSSPSTSIMNLGAQNGNAWENASPEKMTAYNFGNPEGVFVTPEGVAEDAAVSLPGFFSPGTFRQTFDLSGNKSAPDTFGAYDYLALGFARSIGGTTAPAATIDNVTISVPTADRYLQWTFDTGLLEAASTADAFLNTLTDGNLLRDSSGWRKSGASAWTVSNGVLQNDSLQNNNAGEGALARVFHLSTVDDLDGSRLLLRFDYTTGDEAEDLFVHLWGYVESETPSLPNTYLMNLGAQNGNAWESSDVNLPAGVSGILDDYNLGHPEGIWTNNGSGTEGAAADAAVRLTGTAGPQRFSRVFDFSANTSAPALVADYDYVVLAFARDIAGASTPSIAVSNLVLAVPGGAALISSVPAPPLNDPGADPDRDSLVNLVEYALGANPVGDSDAAMLPVPGLAPGGELELVYRRRLDWAARGLVYGVQRNTGLDSSTWSTNGCIETGAGLIDSEFESVTNRLEAGSIVFGRLGVTLKP